MRQWSWLALVVGGCARAAKPGDSAPPTPEPCEVEHAESEDEVMAHWDESLADTVARFPEHAAGPAWRLDGREGWAELSVRWLPGSLRFVMWHDINGECWSTAVTSFAVERLVVDGVDLGVLPGTDSSVRGAGGSAPFAEVRVQATVSGVTGTVLEAPSGRDELRLGLELSGGEPAGPDEVAWRIRGWVDEQTNYSWESVQTDWPLFAAELLAVEE